MDFKIGDIIKGKDNSYGITNKKMTKALVVEIPVTGAMKIKILEHKYECYKGDEFVVDNSKVEFELLIAKKMTKSDLKDGDRVTLRNGKKGIYKSDSHTVSSLAINHINEDLTNNGSLRKSA